ncbi:MAG: hypothetical protein FWG14_07870 [Peptococcaceae bacterium]|nr:hypothetical protein [Peptococcaceae bacterium]
MSGLFRKFFNFLRSLFKGKTRSDHTGPGGTDISHTTDTLDNADTDRLSSSSGPTRIYKRDAHPLRKIYLWGWDQDNNPSFLVLYGVHEFKSTGPRGNVLKEDVRYTDYAIFKGRDGHFPSFEAVKIIETRENRAHVRRMYYKKDVEGVCYWSQTKKETMLTCFKTLGKGSPVSFPYFQQMTHEAYVHSLEKLPVTFDKFRLARTPSDVLQPEPGLAPYTETLCTLLSHPNLYIRKKHLRDLLLSNPPRELYTFLIRVGSNELISGLFLELSRLRNDVLVSEAKAMLQEEITWVSGRYLEGLKRCAALYVTVFDKDAREARTAYLRQTLLKGPIAKSSLCEGSINENINGVNMISADMINTVKAILQEAEIYGLADVIGKTAYELDAPELTHLFKNSGKSKALIYLRRYARRIMDAYAVHDEARFVAAMKTLFISYTVKDYLSKFPGNFQDNYFIRHYLYAFQREIWARHVDDLIEILAEAKVPVVAKAFYSLLKECVNTEYLTQEVPYEKLLRLIGSPYSGAADMFMQILARKLAGEEQFDSTLMLQFFHGSHLNTDQVRAKIHDMAMAYFDRTGGRLSPQGVMTLMFVPDRDEWLDMHRQNLEAFDRDEYVAFLHALIRHVATATSPGRGGRTAAATFGLGMTENHQQILIQSLGKLAPVSRPQMTGLISAVTDLLRRSKKLPDTLYPFLEALVLAGPMTQPLDKLRNLLPSVDIWGNQHTQNVQGRNLFLLSLLHAVKTDTLPSDTTLSDMLELDSAPMMNTLIQVIAFRQALLSSRFSTVLILLESDIPPVQGIAQDVFNTLPPREQKQLHALILDSPDQKVSEYGLHKLRDLYEQPGALIPEDLLLRLLEHPSRNVKSYIAGKLTDIIKTLGNGSTEVFMYYARTLLLLPNRISQAKNTLYDVFPAFVKAHPDRQSEVESLLLDIGGSNIILDAERALMALAKIRREVA